MSIPQISLESAFHPEAPMLEKTYSRGRTWPAPQALTICAKHPAVPSGPSRADDGTAESAGASRHPRNTTRATRISREQLELAKEQSKSSGDAGSRGCRGCARHQAARSALGLAPSREVLAMRRAQPDEAATKQGPRQDETAR